MRDKLLVSSSSSGKLLCAYAGEQVYLIDTASQSSSKIIALPAPSQPAGKADASAPPITALGQVEAVALTADGNKAAALYRHKVLALWDIRDSTAPALLAHRLLPKKAFSLLFAQLEVPGNVQKEDTILVNDKVGDVRAYVATTELLSKSSAFLLGHTASVGTCLDLSPDGTCLASGDRDEKVRLSKFPCTLMIDAYLTGHDNFISSVTFIRRGTAVLTGSGDGTLALWDAQTGAEKVKRVLPFTLKVKNETQREEEGKEEGSNEPSKTRNKATTVPCAVAINREESLAIVTLLGSAELLVYSLPALELVQTLKLPSPPLGAVWLEKGGQEGGKEEVLYVTVGAPEYLMAYVLIGNELQAQIEEQSVVVAVRSFGMKAGLESELTVDEGDEGFLGGMTKENLEVRFEWNSRQRKEEHVEKARQKRQEKRHRERDERIAGMGDGGKKGKRGGGEGGGEASAISKEG